MMMILDQWLEDTRAVTLVHAEQLNTPHDSYQIQCVNIDDFRDYVFAVQSCHFELEGQTHIYLVKCHGGMLLTRNQAVALATFIHKDPVPFLLNPLNLTLHNKRKDIG